MKPKKSKRCWKKPCNKTNKAKSLGKTMHEIKEKTQKTNIWKGKERSLYIKQALKHHQKDILNLNVNTFEDLDKIGKLAKNTFHKLIEKWNNSTIVTKEIKSVIKNFLQRTPRL